KGGINLKRIFGNKALSIFISPPDLKTLEQRLRQRSTEDEKSIEKRVAKASLEMQFANNFDKVLINNSLNETLLTAETLIKEWLKK
ncbi:MAG: guanylate kinase, partial [Bacteroidetes bacterium]|nr:guanylate kinase [Bacteroidota bacterium]